jgi:uncharacterized damage-inducible protein DinB
MLMPMAQMLLPELDHEGASTRKLLEIVPEADASWRPHPKSTTLGDLAAHLATIPLWGRLTVELPQLDLGVPANASVARLQFTTAAEVVRQFDENLRSFRAALAAASDETLRAQWSLLNKGATVMTLPRAAVLRTFVLSHMIHHRGQLTVYLRLRDVPLPSIYGPTADTR